MSKPYTALTTDQQARVAYLFADEIFGTDAHAYRYEVDASGDITGRTPLTTPPAARAQQSAPVMVHTQEAHVTDLMISHARMNMDALAASIAESIFRSTLQEVNS